MALVNPAVVNYRFLKKPFALPAEFTPVGLVYTQYNVLVVNPAVAEMARVRTVADLVAAAKAAGGKLTYTSAGNGSMGHLATALLCNLAGVSMTHVPYRGDAPAMNDVLAGTVPVMFVSSTTALPHLRSGRLRPLAVSAGARVGDLPEVPTLVESGFPGLLATPWFGLVAPPGMPADLVARLTQALKETVAAADVQQKFQAAALTPTYLPPKDMADWVNRDFALWSKVIGDNGIQPN
jgi:tripartite-type tricarboxylate transporter receptor subunit TctC